MNFKKLKDVFEQCKKLSMPVCVVMNIPGQNDQELIINSVASLDNKLRYYENNYDDNLVNKNCNDIKIIAAFPIRFFYDEYDKEASEDL